MRHLRTGVDASGRSCVLEEADLGAVGADPALVDIYSTNDAPPGPRPHGNGSFLDLGVAPGCTRWTVVHWPAGTSYGMHHTETIDYDIVLAGSVELTLGDGVHPLEAGDCVVIAGIDHAWRAGPQGASMSVTLLGSTPPG